MKRSEMIKILNDSFIEHMNETDMADTDEKMYGRILDDLVNAGIIDLGDHNYNE